MPENEFEKHVQEKMKELRLRPSDGVWKAVEEEIRKKKRRRVVFFILLLAGLGLVGYSGYTLLDNSDPVLVKQETPALNNENSNDNQDQLPIQKNKELSGESESTKSAESVVNGILKSADAANSINNEKPNDKKGNKISETVIDITSASASKRKNKQEHSLSVEQNLQTETTVAGKSVQKNDLVKNDIPAINVTGEESSVMQNDIASRDHIQKSEAVTSQSEEISNADTTAATEITSKEYEEKDVMQEDITENKAEPKRKSLSKIKLGLELSAGSVFSRSEAFSLGTTGRFSDVTFNTPNSSSGGGTSANVVAPPSSVKPGPAFKAGIFAQMKLSQRSSVSAGIRYAYLSEKIKVGAYKDTVYLSNGYSQNYLTNGIYQGTKQKSHTNAYHFIEIPLSYQLQLNKGIKIPVFWNMGVSLGYLAGSNALVYDTAAGGVYFKQPDLFNKVHVSMNTGFSFRFGNKGKLQWSLGPEISMDMSKLMKEDPYTRKRYLLYGGVSAKLFLPEIKK